jgi:hypothetical protein
MRPITLSDIRSTLAGLANCSALNSEQQAHCATALDFLALGNEAINVVLSNAAPELLAAAERGLAALAANGAPNCEAAKELRAAIAKARN